MSLGFVMPPDIHRDAFFDSMPKEVREFLGSGFSQLAMLPKASLTSVASQVSRWLDPAEPEPEVDILARQFRVESLEMSAIMSAVTFLASALFAGPSPMEVQTFVDKATNAGILKQGDAAAIQTFGDTDLSTHGSLLSDALLRASLSTRIVPSFQQLATAVDLRVVAVGGERVVAVPVVIATLSTDVSDQELLFQMTARDVGQLVQQLQKLTKQLTRSKGATIHLAAVK